MVKDLNSYGTAGGSVQCGRCPRTMADRRHSRRSDRVLAVRDRQQWHPADSLRPSRRAGAGRSRPRGQGNTATRCESWEIGMQEPGMGRSPSRQMRSISISCGNRREARGSAMRRALESAPRTSAQSSGCTSEELRSACCGGHGYGSRAQQSLSDGQQTDRSLDGDLDRA